MEAKWALSLKSVSHDYEPSCMQDAGVPQPTPHAQTMIPQLHMKYILVESSLASHMLHIHGMNQVNLRFLVSIITSSWKSKLSTNHKRVLVIPEIITDCFPSSIDAIFYCPFIWYTTTTQVHTIICAYFKIECIYMYKSLLLIIISYHVYLLVIALS